MTWKSHKESRPEAVVKYEDYLERWGGLSGGWDTKDHQTFLKLKHHYEDYDDLLIDACMNQIPGVNPDSIQEHIKWHTTLLSLTVHRKAAIEAWKKKKAIQHDKVSEELVVEAEARQKSVTDRTNQQKKEAYRAKQADDLKQYKAEKAQSELDTARKKADEEARLYKRKRQLTLTLTLTLIGGETIQEEEAGGGT